MTVTYVPQNINTTRIGIGIKGVPENSEAVS